MIVRSVLRVLLLVVLASASAVHAATTITVTSNLNAGANTLRQAILDANANASPDPVTIAFAIGSGAVTIAPTAALPAITRPVVIDATTQPDFIDTPLVELRGDSAPNGSSGLVLTGHSGSTVRGLVINRFTNDLVNNGGWGIEIASGSNGHVVAGNRLGTNAAGTAAAANSRGGVRIRGNAVRIGGTTDADRNVIAGNGSFGVFVSEGTGSTISGNFIGVDAEGTTAITNPYGVYVQDPTEDLTVGGSEAGAGNVIAASDTGVSVASDTSEIAVRGNSIGVDVTGTALVGNGSNGILLNGTAGATVDDNVIGGFSTAGIFVQGGTSDVAIQGNRLGVSRTGGVPLPLGNIGIIVQGLEPAPSDLTIGGTGVGDGNVITNCTGRGVSLLGDPIARVALRGNRITGNGGLGIDLGQDGVTLNDQDDTDAGPNGAQNFPVLTKATASASSITIDGSLTSLPDASYALDFFSNAAADLSGFGEGATYLGSATVVTGVGGTVPFAITLPVVVTPGAVITATATDGDGNTSEFSAALASVAPSTTSTSSSSTSSTVAAASTTTAMPAGSTTSTTAPAGSTTSTTATTVSSTSTSTSTVTTVSTSTTSTTLLCDLAGLARVTCLLALLPPVSCAGELPKSVTGKLDVARTLLGKAATASDKAARRLEKRAAARLKKGGRKLAKGAKRGVIAAPCSDELGASLLQLQTLLAELP